MLLNDLKEFKIQYDEELKLMRVEWVSGADMRRFRPALEQLQKLAEYLHVRLGVVDLHKLPDISAYDQIWLGTNWIPKARRMLLKQLSLVLAANQVYNQHSIELVLHTSKSLAKLDVQFFTHAPTAMSWLLEREPRLPELLAEWEADTHLLTSGGPQATEPSPRYGRR